MGWLNSNITHLHNISHTIQPVFLFTVKYIVQNAHLLTQLKTHDFVFINALDQICDRITKTVFFNLKKKVTAPSFFPG